MSEKNIVRPLEHIEAEINFYKQQTATGIIEIGKRLIEAKEQLKHGQWGKWLEEKVDFSQRTANQFMRVATEFSNSQSISNLGTRKLFLLLDVPVDNREEFIDKNNLEEMTTRQLQKEVKNLQSNSLEYNELKIIDIEIAKLKPLSSHDKYFKNMTGEEWIRFLKSIQRLGIIEPILISQNYEIISGVQRVRACKDLGISSIPCRMKKYSDTDVMLQDCLISNLKLYSDDFDIARDALKEHGWL